ncbi:NADH-ubiquinone oxidoreductase, NQO13 subunit [Helicobacter sp. NHP19-003]|uniref:NADH-ubiquinone oxidoreductase, NQO13 subunit n=1 Tax=Helicobacter gastrocanis TaxID=2849641 RepID=A0ABN6I1Y2_9HELI|nr:NADH-quinone oxidoreductase subunit M [Helicobacter sp. NHP19-003]BCZ17002.1 NADH-ubiquinone oxidoreductase, NQO13 subunit [Helicobacter sp. NHP19-003]
MDALLPHHFLSVLIFFPLVACLPLFGLSEKHAKPYGVLVSAIELALVVGLWVLFDKDTGVMQFEEFADLVKQAGINYHVGVDGISLTLLVLTAFILFLLALYVSKHIKDMLICILLLEGILMGVFTSLNLIFFYVFWEVSLLPVLYMIGRYGVGPKVYSGLKFFLYTFLASLFMLLAILYYAHACSLALETPFNFDLETFNSVVLPPQVRLWVFIAFFVGIAVKIPIFPLHNWLPHAYGNAPVIGSAVLSALLLKMGTYAMVRFLLPLFPNVILHYFLPLSVLALLMVLYGGLLACAQKEMKRLIAYSSMSHMGVAVLGLYAFNVEGVGGAVFTMFSHGLVSAGLFILVGVLFDRCNSSKIVAFKGVAHLMPTYAAFFMVLLLANVGMPLTSGFVGEFLSLLGFFKSSPFMAFLAGTTIILSAIYMLVLYKKVFFGAEPSELYAIKKAKALNPLTCSEKSVLALLVAAVLFLGIYPKPLLSPIEQSVQVLLESLQGRINA